jgi:hypothetical protein
LALAGWEIFLNPSGVGLAPPSGRLLSVFLRKGIAYESTSPFPLRRQYSAATKKSKYNASSSALHAMALAVNGVRIPRLALIVVARGKSRGFSKAFLGASITSQLALAVEVAAL